jgi:ribosomal protein S18 acetylase RimI-like enzyme
MGIRVDSWLAERFGHPVYTIDAKIEPGELKAFSADAPGMYQARVPAGEVGAVQGLCRAGMYVVDLNLTLGRQPNTVAPPSGVRGAVPLDRQDVLAIAESSFRWSRFHLDPAVPPEVANRIKRDWAESYFEGTRGEELLVAVHDGRPVGFLAILGAEEDGRTLRVVDLIAVNNSSQGKGVGRALTEAFLHRSTGTADEVRVGTQAANTPATRLYESMGFALVRATYVLHMHVGAA